LNPKLSIRELLAKVPASLLVALAFGGFWVLSRGMTAGPGSLIGYADQQLHSIGPLQTGRLMSVNGQLGQSVHKGDVLAVLDTRPLLLQQEQLQAELEQAKAQLVAEQDIQNSLLQRGQLQAVRIHATEEREHAELRELELQLKRLEKLNAEHLVRASEIEATRRQQRAVAADLQARNVGTPYEQQQMGLRPRANTEQVERLQERLAPYRAALRVKEAALHQLELAISEMTLRAPVDGMIGTILQRPGDVVGAGAPVLTLITMRPGSIVAFVPERRFSNITAGSSVTLRRVGTFASALHGHVVELAPMLEEVPLRARPAPSVPFWARRVVIQLDKPAPLLPGEAFNVSTR